MIKRNFHIIKLNSDKRTRFRQKKYESLLFVFVIKFHVKCSDKEVNKLNLNQKEVIYLNFNVIKIFIKSNLKT